MAMDFAGTVIAFQILLEWLTPRRVGPILPFRFTVVVRLPFAFRRIARRPLGS